MTLRDYQERAVERTLRCWGDGVRAVLVVAPTGAGKTTIGAEVALRADPPVVWIAHRRELIAQAEERLAAHGVLATVASVDTLHARGREAAPPARTVIWDEAHHCAADTYREVLSWYPESRVLGLTATPQRGDGRALGDQYDVLIPVTRYSTLIAEGHLVPCRVLRPDEPTGSDLAHEPLAAWQRWGEGRQTFAYGGTVEQVTEWAQAFVAAGIPSAVVHGAQSARERIETLLAFRAGELRVLWNVHVLTEGVDVPAASCVLLARACSAAGTYLQMVGRVLRPAEGKRDALLIDLPGISHVHGLPTADREYHLDGRPIRVVGERLAVCQQCGYCYEAARRECPECGFARPVQEREGPKIYSRELREVVEAAGGDLSAVPGAARVREWERLRRLAADRGWAPGWAVRQYRQLFGSAPPPWVPTPAELALERASLERIARERGYRPGWVRHKLSALGGGGS